MRAGIAVTGIAMIEEEVEHGATAEMIRAQLDLLVRDDAFRSSKRSVAFLKYVVEETLNGSAEQIKERTIGVEVFGRDPSYDTSLDHICSHCGNRAKKKTGFLLRRREAPARIADGPRAGFVHPQILASRPRHTFSKRPRNRIRIKSRFVLNSKCAQRVWALWEPQ